MARLSPVSRKVDSSMDGDPGSLAKLLEILQVEGIGWASFVPSFGIDFIAGATAV